MNVPIYLGTSASTPSDKLGYGALYTKADGSLYWKYASQAEVVLLSDSVVAGSITSGMFDASVYGSSACPTHTSNVAGAASTLSRSDHQHQLGTNSVGAGHVNSSLYSTTACPVSAATALGSDTAFARGDHRHHITDGSVTNAMLAGSVSPTKIVGGTFGAGTYVFPEDLGVGASPDTVFEARQASEQRWVSGSGSWTGASLPEAALVISNSQPGGYDPTLVGRSATSASTLKTVFAMGSVAEQNWADANTANQVSSWYLALRNTSETLIERLRITSGGALTLTGTLTSSGLITAQNGLTVSGVVTLPNSSITNAMLAGSIVPDKLTGGTFGAGNYAFPGTLSASGLVTAGSGLQVVGTLTLPTGSITSAMLADGTIVDADIASGAAINPSKLTGGTFGSGQYVFPSRITLGTSNLLTLDQGSSGTKDGAFLSHRTTHDGANWVTEANAFASQIALFDGTSASEVAGRVLYGTSASAGTLTGLTSAFLWKFNGSVEVPQGSLTVRAPASNVSLSLDSTTIERQLALSFQKGAAARWSLGVTNSAESGSNAGSDFFLIRNADNGTQIDTPLSISRATGAWTIAGSVTSGSILTPSLTVRHPTGQPLLDLDATTPVNYATLAYRKNNLLRWTVAANNTAESGSNAGSDFEIKRYNDAGAIIDTPLFFQRSTGQLIIGNAANDAALIVNPTVKTKYASLVLAKSGLWRWSLSSNETAEGGSNTGSDFGLIRYNDAGSYIGYALLVSRTNGQITLGGHVVPFTHGGVNLGLNEVRFGAGFFSNGIQAQGSSAFQTLSTEGSATLGDTSGDSHTINGALTLPHQARVLLLDYSGSQEVTSVSPHIFTFDTVPIDTSSMSSSGSGITFTKAGTYYVFFRVLISGASGDAVRIDLSHNTQGDQAWTMNGTTSGPTTEAMSGGMLYDVAAGNTIQLKGTAYSSGTWYGIPTLGAFRVG